MGKDKTTTTTSETSTPTASPEEKEYNRLQLQQQKTIAPASTQAQLDGLRLSQQLLSGGPLPGEYQGLYGGITPDITNELAQQAINDINPQFVGSGLLDSGVRASILARTSGDIRRNSAQFNLENRRSLLGLGVEGQYAPHQAGIAYGGMLSQRLQGLRSTTGTGTSQTLGANPFLKSFQTSLGTNLGQSLGTFGFKSGPSGGFKVGQY